jgi:pimeloyl-ACP methyl ester carboxylesterase
VYDFRTAGIGRDPDGRPDLAKPSLVLTAGEAVRFPAEYAASWLVDRLPASDLGGGRPVLVIPGFGATDVATRRLRHHLRQRGWHVHAWRVGANHGLTDTVLDGVLQRFDEVYERHDEPVSVVGWSFGGLLARWVAHQRPAQVRQVVTMGSPWRPEGERTRTTRMFERSRRIHGISERAEKVIDELRGPVPVFATAIWSKTDGIVPWRGCALDEDEPGQLAENIHVPSSHLGLVSNPFALAALTDRLAQDPSDLRPFEWRRVLARRAS